MNKNSGRDQRLYPSIFNELYYHLTLLRIHINEIKDKYVKKDSVLVDVGCGSKPYVPIFDPFVIKYIGVDIAENKEADLFLEADNSITLKDNSADIVLSTQVLEHVEAPLKYLSECRRILKQDGILILSTHGYWVYHQSPEDYWRWTSVGLKTLLKEAHFEIIELRGMMGLAPTAVQLFQIAILNKIPTRLFRNIFISMLQSLIVILDRCCSKESTNRDACTYLIVARK